MLSRERERLKRRDQKKQWISRWMPKSPDKPKLFSEFDRMNKKAHGGIPSPSREYKANILAPLSALREQRRALRSTSRLMALQCGAGQGRGKPKTRTTRG